SGLAQARPHHPPPPPDTQVLVRQGDQLTLSQDRGWHKDVVLDQDTAFFEGREADPGVRDSLKAGDYVVLRDRLQSDGLWHVEELHRRKGRPVHGRVLSVTSGGFLIDNHGEPVQVDVSASTQYHMGWLPGSSSFLKVDRPAMVEGQQVGPNHVEATEVNVPFPWISLAAGIGLSGLVGGLAWRRRHQMKTPRVDD
ncbi:hypothetical protein JST97_37370, partial [bacterium]|nr:hypothetical protein [bacterium]